MRTIEITSGPWAGLRGYVVDDDSAPVAVELDLRSVDVMVPVPASDMKDVLHTSPVEAVNRCVQAPFGQPSRDVVWIERVLSRLKPTERDLITLVGREASSVANMLGMSAEEALLRTMAAISAYKLAEVRIGEEIMNENTL